MHHDLKTWPVYFRAAKSGEKPFDVRRNDRNFRVGDFVTLREYDPATETLTDDTATFVITYILPGSQFGILPGFVVLGLKRVPDAPASVTVKVKPAPPEVPHVVHQCTVIFSNPVIQVVEDERGGRHELKDNERDAEAGEGDYGTLKAYADGRRQFTKL